MKILNISALYPPNVIGGAELAVHNLARQWAKDGHTVHALTLDKPNAEPSHGYIEGVHYVRLPLHNKYWPYGNEAKPGPVARLLWHARDTNNASMSQEVVANVLRIRPDVVLTNNLQGFSTRVIQDVARLGFPVIHVAHDCSLICVRASLFKNNRHCATRCFDCAALTRPRRPHVAHARGVIAVSESVLKQHRKYGLFNATPSRVIGNALRSDLKPALRVVTDHQQPVSFGYMGRIEPAKGIETLLEAATRLKQKGSTFSLKIAGTGNQDYVAYLKERWAEASAEYLGFCEPSSLYSTVNAIVFPSESYESFGTVIMEAYSQGLPVIATDCGGPAEIVWSSTGRLVPRGNPDRLADAMFEFVSLASTPHDAKHSKLQALGCNARQIAKAYNVEEKAAEYLGFIDSVLSKRT